MELPSWIGTALILFIIQTSFNSSRVNCQVYKRTNTGVSFAQFVGNPFTRLNVSLLESLQVSSLGECTFECINHHNCFSVNFGNQAHGKHTCELINTDKFNQPGNFVISQEFYHYNIKVGPDNSFVLVVKSSVWINVMLCYEIIVNYCNVAAELQQQNLRFDDSESWLYDLSAFISNIFNFSTEKWTPICCKFDVYCNICSWCRSWFRNLGFNRETNRVCKI